MDENGQLVEVGWEGVNESESIMDFNFCGTKILRIGDRLKINPGKKKGLFLCSGL